MAKKKINSYKEYMKVAMDYVFGDMQNMDKAHWDNVVRARYMDENADVNYNVKDFANQELMGRTGNSVEAFNLISRLDREIESGTSPSKKAAAIAVRRVVAPMLYDIAECKTFEAADAFRSKIEQEYEISPKLEEELADMKARARTTIDGLNGADPKTASKISYLSSNQKIDLIASLVNTFFDRDAGKQLSETPVMKELMEMVSKEVNTVSKSIAGEKGYSFKPMDDIDKKDYESLKSTYKKMNNSDKQGFSVRSAAFTQLKGFANMGIAPNLTQANLVLENNPLVDISAETFFMNQKLNELSFTEIEWGEATIDRMVRSIYTDDELRKLKSADIDPAMGIMVDGKPLSFYSDKDGQRKSPLDTAKTKCEMIARALDGATLSVSKFVPDGKGGFEAGTIVPVKTDFSMKTEKRSFMQWLKQTLGFEPSIKSRIKKANEVDKRADAPALRSAEAESAKKVADSIKMRKAIDANKELTNKLDSDFFDDSFKATLGEENYANKLNFALGKSMTFTNESNQKSLLFNHLDKKPRRVNLLLCYGLSKGYSMEQLTHEDNKELRTQLGAEFLQTFGMQTYDEFAKSKGLEQGDETRKQYNKYLLEKREKAEIFCANAYEALRNIKVPSIDCNNLSEVAEKGPWVSRLGNMTCDFVQAVDTLTRNRIAPSDPAISAAAERSKNLYNYIYYKTLPLQEIGKSMRTFTNHVASETYTTMPSELKSNEKLNIQRAAIGKTVLNYLGQQRASTFSDIMDNDNLSNTITGIDLTTTNMGANYSDDVYRNLNDFVATGKNSPAIDANTKELSIADEKINYSASYTASQTLLNKSVNKYNESVNRLGDNAKHMSPAEIHAAIIDMTNNDIAATKESRSTVMSVDELMSDQPEKKEKATAKEKSTEKAAEMEEDVISFEDMVGKEKTEPINVQQKKAPEMHKEMGGFGI